MPSKEDARIWCKYGHADTVRMCIEVRNMDMPMLDHVRFLEIGGTPFDDGKFYATGMSLRDGEGWSTAHALHNV